MAAALLLGHCDGFKSYWPQYVACERADGTLRSLRGIPGAEWRVRYFVKYAEMPCGEAPTVEEGYVFHSVWNDLYDDSDLTDTQRIAIRDEVYRGTPTCP